MPQSLAAWFTPRHVRGTHEEAPVDHRAPDPGRRVDRRRLFERGDRAPARHLAPNRQGPLRHPPPEARRLETASDSRRLPTPDRARSPVEKPRASPKRPRGLTAPAPAVDPTAGAGQLRSRSRRSVNGGSVCVDTRLDRSRGDGDRGSGAGCIGGAPPPPPTTRANTPPRPNHTPGLPPPPRPRCRRE